MAATAVFNIDKLDWMNVPQAARRPVAAHIVGLARLSRG